MNKPKTEIVNFNESKAPIAIGLDCETRGRIKADDVFFRYKICKLYQRTKWFIS